MHSHTCPHGGSSAQPPELTQGLPKQKAGSCTRGSEDVPEALGCGLSNFGVEGGPREGWQQSYRSRCKRMSSEKE